MTTQNTTKEVIKQIVRFELTSSDRLGLYGTFTVNSKCVSIDRILKSLTKEQLTQLVVRVIEEIRYEVD